MTQSEFVKIIRGLLAWDERFRGWTFARSGLDGQIHARAPSGQCYYLAVVPMPAGGADALALEATAKFLDDPANAG